MSNGELTTESPAVHSASPARRWRNFRDPQVLTRWVLAVVLGALGLAILSISMGKGISHDEHQFAVPGYLTFQKGLMPYRDYPLFHLPYLVLLNGFIAWVLPAYKMLALRLLVAVAVTATMLILASFAWRRFGNSGRVWRVGGTLGVAVLFTFTHVTGYTAQLIWNHGVPVALVLTAFLLQIRGLADSKPNWVHFWSGLLLGVAVGMRLTFLPLFAPFGLILLLQPGATAGRRLKTAAAFSAGGILAGLPVFVLWGLYPEQFLFGNILYPKLSLVWRDLPFWEPRTARRVHEVHGLKDLTHPGLNGLTPAIKWKLFCRRSVPLNWPLYSLFVLSLPVALWGLIRSRGRDSVLLLSLLCVPFAAIGCMAPSRFNAQYYYAAVPFLILVIISAWSALAQAMGQRSGLLAIGAAAVGAISLGWSEYAEAPGPFKVGSWKPSKLHDKAGELRTLVPDRSARILTLEPLLLVEAGMDVLPEVSSGEFGWRASHLLPRAQRQELKLLSPLDLDLFVQEQRLDGIEIAEKHHDKEMFTPLLGLAKKLGFTPANEDRTLWLRPGLREK